jgi:hypothetical protein
MAHHALIYRNRTYAVRRCEPNISVKTINVNGIEEYQPRIMAEVYQRNSGKKYFSLSSPPNLQAK